MLVPHPQSWAREMRRRWPPRLLPPRLPLQQPDVRRAAEGERRCRPPGRRRDPCRCRGRCCGPTQAAGPSPCRQVAAPALQMDLGFRAWI